MRPECAIRWFEGHGRLHLFFRWIIGQKVNCHKEVVQRLLRAKNGTIQLRFRHVGVLQSTEKGGIHPRMSNIIGAKSRQILLPRNSTKLALIVSDSFEAMVEDFQGCAHNSYHGKCLQLYKKQGSCVGTSVSLIDRLCGCMNLPRIVSRRPRKN